MRKAIHLFQIHRQSNEFCILLTFTVVFSYLIVRLVHNVVFILTRFATMVLAFLTLFYGIENISQTKRSFMLATVFGLQGYLIFDFISNVLKSKRETAADQPSKSTTVAAPTTKGEKTKKERKKESDLPEADQNAQSSPVATSGKASRKAKVK